jgi:hypothetical protein
VYTLVRRFIKTGIGFLFVGLVLGFWMLARRELLDVFPHPRLVSAHAHAVLVGFVMFLILGVALWLFPRAAKEDTRYTPGRAEAAYWILLISTAGRFVAEAGRAWVDLPGLGWIVVLGGAGQVGILRHERRFADEDVGGSGQLDQARAIVIGIRQIGRVHQSFAGGDIQQPLGKFSGGQPLAIRQLDDLPALLKANGLFHLFHPGAAAEA